MSLAAADVGPLLQGGYRFAHSLTHDAAQAEDIVHDAWSSMLSVKAPWTQAYLFKAIRNRFIDLCRRQKRIAFESLTEGHDRGAAPEPTDGLDTETYEFVNGALDAALSQLRAEERAVLYLAGVEEYTAARIAELLDCPRGTVLSLMHRARQKVRRFVAEHAEQVR